MTPMDLSPFCGRDLTRPYLQQPFSYGEWTYATNGHICVRVPRRPTVEENENMKDKAANLFLQNTASEFSPMPKVTIPADLGEDDDCNTCDGRGTEHDCPDCECLCEDCGGSGKEPPGSRISIGIGEGIYQGSYVLLMQTLPAVEIAKPDKEKPLCFRFDGGEGLLMPRRSELSNHIVAGASD